MVVVVVVVVVVLFILILGFGQLFESRGFVCPSYPINIFLYRLVSRCIAPVSAAFPKKKNLLERENANSSEYLYFVKSEWLSEWRLSLLVVAFGHIGIFGTDT